MIETREHSGRFKATASVYGMSYKSAFRYSVRKPTVEAGADPELLQYRGPKAEHVNVHDEIANREIEQCRWERMMRNGNGNAEPEPPRYCHCRELVLHGKRIPMPKGHCCEYVAARTFLVERAADLATQKVVESTGDKDFGYRWTAEFVRILDRLCYNAGLLK